MALTAWLVFPVLALAICVGIGLLAERAAGAEVPPALLPALGYATAIVVLGPLCAAGAGGGIAAVVLVIAALGGYATAMRTRADAGATRTAEMLTECRRRLEDAAPESVELSAKRD